MLNHVSPLDPHVSLMLQPPMFDAKRHPPTFKNVDNLYHSYSGTFPT